jgi:hypothetical protein
VCTKPLPLSREQGDHVSQFVESVVTTAGSSAAMSSHRLSLFFIYIIETIPSWIGALPIFQSALQSHRRRDDGAAAAGICGSGRNLRRHRHRHLRRRQRRELNGLGRISLPLCMQCATKFQQIGSKNLFQSKLINAYVKQ